MQKQPFPVGRWWGVKSLRTWGLKRFRTGGGWFFCWGEGLVPQYMPWTYPGQQNAKEITL